MLCSPQKFEREPSLGVVQPTHPHERSFFVSTFEDQTQEDTLAKERWARGEACRLGHKRAQTHWRLGSKQGNILLTFGSLESSCAIIDQTRGKIVLSWIRVPSCTPSRKDLNSAALETVRAFRTSTKVISANRGSANERGSDNVCQRVGFIRDSTALRRHTAQFYRFDNAARLMEIPLSGQVVKKHILRNSPRNAENFVPTVVPGLSSGSSSSSTAQPSTTSSSQDSTRQESTQTPEKKRIKTGPKIASRRLGADS